MPQDRQAIIAENSVFYRNQFRFLLTLTFVLIGIAFLLIGFIIYQAMTLPTPQYFVTTSNGQLFEIQPLP